MIILFSGCDKVKGFNTRIKEVINKELDRYNSMAVICASDDYGKNDTLIDGTSDMMGIRNMFNSIKEFYLIDRRTSINDMINIIKKRKFYKSKKQDHKVRGTFCMSKVDTVETAQNDKQCAGATENGA